MIGNWQERIDELESENYDLSQENERLDDDLSEAFYKIDLLEDRVAGLEESNRDLEDSLAQDREEADGLSALAYGLETECQELSTLYLDTQARANSWFEVAKLLVRQRNYWITQVDKADERARADRDYRGERENYEELERAYEDLESERDELKSRAGYWQIRAENAEENIRIAANTVDGLRERADTADADVKRFRALYFDADDERSELRRKLEGVEAYSDLQGTIDHYRERAEEAEDRYQAIYADFAAAAFERRDEAVANVRRTHENETEIAWLCARIEKAETCNADLRNRVAALAVQLGNEKNRATSAEARAEKAEAELRELKKALRTLAGKED